jgi:hypothetical protein
MKVCELGTTDRAERRDPPAQVNEAIPGSWPQDRRANSAPRTRAITIAAQAKRMRRGVFLIREPAMMYLSPSAALTSIAPTEPFRLEVLKRSALPEAPRERTGPRPLGHSPHPFKTGHDEAVDEHRCSRWGHTEGRMARELGDNLDAARKDTRYNLSARYLTKDSITLSSGLNCCVGFTIWLETIRFELIA